MFHHNWVKTPGRVLDSRLRKVLTDNMGAGVRHVSIPMHNYIIEFRAPNGEMTKLEVEQHVETVAVNIGDEVPLLVSPDGTKAIFDAKDPKINVVAVAKAAEAADQERFRNQLKGDSEK